MRPRLIVAVLLAPLPAIGGCGGSVLYDWRPQFEYRVVGDKEIRPTDLRDDQSQPPAPGQITYTSLRAEGLAIEASSGGKLGVLAAGESRPAVLVTTGDSATITLPPGIGSIGFDVRSPQQSAGAAQPALEFITADGSRRVPVPWAAPGDSRPKFVGMVSYRPITSVIWSPGARAEHPDTGITAILIEPPK
jgi:hypothetical protein